MEEPLVPDPNAPGPGPAPETGSPAPAPAPETGAPGRPEAVPAWVGLVTGTGLALTAVAALTFVAVVAQGLTVDQDTSIWYRLGIAFLRNLDAGPLGLVLVVAIALLVLPTVGHAPTTDRQDRQAALALGLSSAVSVLVAVAAVIAVLTRFHFDDAPGQEITTLTRWVLVTFVLRNLGPALIALGASVVAMRVRFPVGPEPPGPVTDES